MDGFVLRINENESRKKGMNRLKSMEEKKTVGARNDCVDA